MKQPSDFCRCQSCNRINPGKEMFCLTCGSAELEPVGNELPFDMEKSCGNCLWFYAGFRDPGLEAHRPDWITGECENHKVEQRITVNWGMLCHGQEWAEKLVKITG